MLLRFALNNSTYRLAGYLKKRRKRLPVIRKSVPLQADYYLKRISI